MPAMPVIPAPTARAAVRTAKKLKKFMKVSFAASPLTRKLKRTDIIFLTTRKARKIPVMARLSPQMGKVSGKVSGTMQNLASIRHRGRMHRPASMLRSRLMRMLPCSL